MGLLGKFQGWHRRRRNSRSHSVRKAVGNGLRLCRFEQMEPRQYLSAAPIQVGAVYYENHDQNDAGGDRIEITFSGGAPGTQLTQLIINTDKTGDGLTIGDVFFDTAAGGGGAFGYQPVSVVDKTGIDSVNFTVADGGTQLVIDFTGFDAGEKLVFTIDVDEQGFLGANAIAEGNEFEGSTMTATFAAPHYYSATGSDMFIDFYDQKLQQSGLDLPPDDYTTPAPLDQFSTDCVATDSVYTAGAIFSLQQNPLPITIAGTVFEDIDLDNVHDTSESGIAGVKLTLFRWEDGQYVSTGKTTTTDANGNYHFDDLLPGTYRILETQPDGYLSVGATAGKVDGTTRGEVVGTDEIRSIELLGGDDSVGNDFGEVRPGSLNGNVYLDANNNGVFDSSEHGIAGATVWLLDGSGQRIVSTTTDSNGHYAFVGLRPGTYGIEEIQPPGYLDGKDQLGTAGGTLTNDKVTQIAIGPTIEGSQYNFGEILPSMISGRVAVDTNGNGQYDAGDVLLSGVTVWLLDASGSHIRSTTTDENGEYEFRDLAPGTYGVQEIQPTEYLDGSDHVGTAGGSLLAPDSIIDVTLVSGTDAQHYDFYELVPVSLSGYVYVDDNNNGQRNAGEAGIAGVTLTLLDSSGNPTGKTAVTDSNGYYKFEGLTPGAIYGVAEAQPTGYLDGLDTAGTAGGTAHNPGDKITDVDLGYGVQGKNYNFGELRPASISGTVFVDKDDDGLIDSNEGRIAGVTVWLLDGSGQRIRSTVTDSQGRYAFTDLVPGTYGVEEVQPSAYFDGKDHLGTAGGTLANDRMTEVSLGSGVSGQQYDFGEIMPAKLSGYVFQDGPTVTYKEGDPVPDPLTGHDGKFTPDDTPLAGVVLHLGDATGAPIRDAQGNLVTAVTDANGYYEFKNLKPGVYTVLEAQPGGYEDGIDTAGSEGGIAVNRDSVIDPEVLNQLVIDPKNDAILRIVISGGDNAVSYNFSEVKLKEIPDNPPPYNPPDNPEPPPAKPGLPYAEPIPAVINQPAAPQTVRTMFLGGGGYSATYTWHLSVIDAGQPRREQGGITMANLVDSPLFNPVSWQGAPMDHAQWVIADQQGTVTNQFLFGLEGGSPITGDFNGDGVTEVGVFFDGVWFIDLNGNGVWDEGDLWIRMGKAGDQPVTGDWDGDGKTDIGVYGTAWQGDGRAIQAEPGLPDTANHRVGRPKNVPPKPEEATDGYRTLKRTAQGSMRSDLIDHVFQYGSESDRAVTGDWTGNGVTKIGVYRDGTWYLDMDGDGRWSKGDQMIKMGTAADLPVTGDWTGDGKTKLGLYRDGVWHLDINNDYRIDANDRVFQLGGPHDKPITGDFNGDGISEAAVYQESFTKPEEQASTEAATPHVAARPQAEAR